MTDRYHIAGSQGTWQPGSHERVLLNQLSITDPALMDEAELELLLQLYKFILMEDFPDRQLEVADLKAWHRLWLGNLYDWAGQERSVNMGKDGFQFAAAAQVPRLLTEFEQTCLRRWTPCSGMDESALTQAIATCHVELILIHPFREGNGRLARLLADVMAVQAGHEPLDYSSWDAAKPAYLAAIHQGMTRNYAPMQQLVGQALT